MGPCAGVRELLPEDCAPVFNSPGTANPASAFKGIRALSYWEILFPVHDLVEHFSRPI